MQNRTYVYIDLKKFYENLDPVYMQDKKRSKGVMTATGFVVALTGMIQNK
jgi:hypothetical protein